MRAHLVQLDIAWEDKRSNHERVRTLLGAAGVEPGDLVAMPEMFDTGFSLNVERTAADPEFSVAFLHALAAEFRATAIASVPVMERDGRARNRAFLITPDGRTCTTYDKVHPFSYGQESERFAGGTSVSVASVPLGASARRVMVCPVVCYDLRFPELFRIGLDQGAEMFVVVANWPRERAEHWRTLLIARAIENQAIVLGVNRTGEDPNLRYVGGSIAVDPRGRILGEAGAGEGVLSVALDPGWISAWRGKFPAWQDRRIAVGKIGSSPPESGVDAKNPTSDLADRLTPAELRVSSKR